MPSPAASKAKGAKFEGELRDWMQSTLEPLAVNSLKKEFNGRPIVIEAKAEKSYDIPAYVREAKREMEHANALHWAVVMRKRGTTNIGEAFVVLDLDEWVRQVGPRATQVERIRLSGAKDRGDLSGIFLP